MPGSAIAARPPSGPARRTVATRRVSASGPYAESRSTIMNDNTAELWGGVALLALGAALLFAPLALTVEYTLAPVLFGALGLAIGSILVALARRGRVA